MGKIADWVEARTGVRAALGGILDEEIRGGARWAYALGSCLVVLLAVECVTGIVLMLTYAPSTDTAWASVWYIQHRVTAGWLVRGLHFYGAQAIVVVLGLHLLQVVVYGAYKKPREVTWWLGIVLLLLVQAFAITGNPLPWDLRGYWAIIVETNIAGAAPVIGQQAQLLVVGDSQYGQLALTRLFAIHVAVLPAIALAIVALHVALVRRHKPTPPAGADTARGEPYWPGQAARDVVFSVVVLAVVAVLTAMTRGADLEAPADPEVDYSARPEWYFLFLYAMRKLVPPSLDSVATMVVPGIAMAFLFALPLLDRKESTRVRDRLPWVAAIVLGAIGLVALTAFQLRADAQDRKHQRVLAAARVRGERASALARRGIPPGGGLELLRNDPMTHGADLYRKQCVSCHVLGELGEREAPEHTGFGSREWIYALLMDPDGARFFGPTDLDPKMPSQRRLGVLKLRAVTEFVFSLGREPRDPPVDAALVARGEEVFKQKCMECHLFRGDGDFLAEGGPNLTGWGSRSWMARQIADPDAAYGEINQMPAFDEELDAHDIEMVSAYLRRQRFERPATGPVPPRRRRARH